MNQFKLHLFEIFSLTWISVATFGLIFALLGIFNVTLILLSLLLTIGVFIILYRRGVLEFSKPSPTSTIVLLLILAVAILLSLHTTPTIFGGRDEGSYSNAAILLANDHQLNHTNDLIKDFFQIYGPGKALNFPGFIYSDSGQLQSQFLPGYISWLGVLYALFGLKGLAFANLLPWLTFLFSFYLVLRKVLRQEKFLAENSSVDEAERKKIRWFSVIGCVFLFSSFPMILFYKFTLSEIFFGALIWFTFYLILRYFEHKSFSNYLLVFLPFILMVFTRIEALGFVFILFFLFVLKDFNHMRQAKYQFVYSLLAGLVAISLVYNSNFFVDTVKNVLEPFVKTAERSVDSTKPQILSEDLQGFYLPKVFFTYNLLPFLLFGGLFVLVLLKKKTLRLLIPFFFFLPTLVYLIDANISLDHPWMLRRFLFAVIPIFILYSTLFLQSLSSFRWGALNFTLVSLVLAGAMIFINLTLVFPNFSWKNSFVVYSQNQNLVKETEILSQYFTDKDLILLSQKSSGSGWSLMAEPLRNIYNRQAIYFFNPYNLSQLNLNEYNNVYLVTSLEEDELYHDLAKEKILDYSIDNNVIVPQKDPLSATQTRAYQAQGLIYKLQK